MTMSRHTHPIPPESPAPIIHRVGTLSYTKAGLAMLFLWLLWGDFCYVLMESVVPSILPLRLKALEASNTTIGLILTTAPMIINIVVNPVVSFCSDRHRGPRGRRIPYLSATLLPLVTLLILLGYSDRIGLWLHSALGSHAAGFTPNQVALGTVAAIMILFSLFNSVVNAVFWYLFNDVVPEVLLARFMSWFRIVGTLAVSAYNFFVFEYAESHAAEIFVGAALLYLVGLGLMCWRVKEGDYPPPPKNIDHRSGIWSAVTTYGRECHRYGHYMLIFLVSICTALGVMASAPFMLFLYQSTGLSLHQIGTVVGVSSISSAVFVLGAGWLADRFHPTRVVIAGLLGQVCLALPAQCVFLLWKPSPQVAFYAWIVICVFFISPAAALVSMFDPPLFMRYFPRERYGQFCSANALWRSLALIMGGVAVGRYLDCLKDRVGATRAYLWLPVWQWFFCMLMLIVMWRVYRSWQRHGGDKAYAAPAFEK